MVRITGYAGIGIRGCPYSLQRQTVEDRKHRPRKPRALPPPPSHPSLFFSFLGQPKAKSPFSHLDSLVTCCREGRKLEPLPLELSDSDVLYLAAPIVTQRKQGELEPEMAGTSHGALVGFLLLCPTWEKKGFISSWSLQSITKGSQERNLRRNLKAGTELEAMGSTSPLTCSCGWLSLLSYTIQEHLCRRDTWAGPPTSIINQD